MATPSGTKEDGYYWLAYCDAIRTAAGVTVGADQAMMFASTATRGIPASATGLIPQEVTNGGTYQMADNMLNSDNLMFVPNLSFKWDQLVHTYLQYVDLGGNPSSGALQKLAMDTTQANSDSDYRAAQQLKALAQWKVETANQITTLDFLNWATQNAPAYQNAINQANASGARVTADYNDIYGPLASTWTIDNNRLNDALNPATTLSHQGLNMACVLIDSSTAATYYQSLQGGPKPAAPVGSYNTPLYAIQGYPQQVDDWIAAFPQNNAKPPGSTNVSKSIGSSISVSSFGIDQSSGGGSWAPIPCISFGAAGSSQTERESMSVSNTSYVIDIQITYGAMKLLPIQTGNWDIGDPTVKYPKLRMDAPPRLAASLVRPTQLLCGTAIGMTVSMSGGADSTFDSMYSKYSSGGGYVNILGISISLGGSSSTEDASHVGTWDYSAHTFTVKPTNDAGTCTLLAVLGTKARNT